MTGSAPSSLYIFDKLGQETQDWVVSAVLYLPKILVGLLIFALTTVIAKYTQKAVDALLRRAKVDKTVAHIILLVVRWLIMLIGIMMTMSALGLNGMVASLLAGAGFTSVVIAFGTQDISKNLLAGGFIILGKQFRIGDNIIVQGGHEGIVRRIDLRAVTLESTDGRQITVPNNVIFSNVVTNLTARGRRKVMLELNVNAEKSFEELREDLTELLLKQQTIFKKPKPEILLTQITGKYNTISITYWSDSSPMMQRRSISEINEELITYLQTNELFTEWIRKA